MKLANLAVFVALISFAGAFVLDRFRRAKSPAFAGFGPAAAPLPALSAGRRAWRFLALFVTGGTGAESFNVQDAGASVTLALPNAASTTVTSAGIDTGGQTALAFQNGNFEFLINAPALTTTQLPNAATMTYNIVQADNAAMSTNLTVLAAGVLVQTGAAGAGAAAAKTRYRLPSVSQRYIGLQIVSGSTATDSHTVSATLNPVF